MKLQVVSQLVVLVLMALTTAGCEFVEGIFKAGVWTGVIAVVVVVGLLVAMIGRVRTWNE